MSAPALEPLRSRYADRLGMDTEQASAGRAEGSARTSGPDLVARGARPSVTTVCAPPLWRPTGLAGF